jgi:aryl-alcohol dehydrogenase-like predicted oxidoreductase
MQTNDLGPLKGVSRLTLGGGGLGGVWGAREADEAIATARAAVEAGINLIDLAPVYGDAQALVARAFDGAPPAGVRFTSKCMLGTPESGAAGVIIASLEETLKALERDRIDLFFLHSNICPDGYVYAHGVRSQARFATAWSVYEGEVVPTFERLREEGRIGAWGITAVGVPQAIHRALRAHPAPQVAQVVANLMDSAGGMRRFAEPLEPRKTLGIAKEAGIGVMGIRAVQAGALTAAFDREVAPDSSDGRDYLRAEPFRRLCADWGEDPARIAHRYALGMAGVDTVVLGVKNRRELEDALAAERAGPLGADQVAAIDALGLAGEA